MSLSVAMVLIVALMVFGGLWHGRQNARNGHAIDEKGNAILPSPREKELEAELTELRERVKVLERIATDDREAKRLSSEIEQLRDE